MLWPQPTVHIRSAHVCWSGVGYPNLSAPQAQGSCLSLSPTGSYCLLPGLVAMSGPCSAGFHCAQGASLPNPTDRITGDLCPPGHFCPQGSPRPTPCPRGESLVDEHRLCRGLLWAREGKGVKTQTQQGSWGRLQKNPPDCSRRALSRLDPHSVGLVGGVMNGVI